MNRPLLALLLCLLSLAPLRAAPTYTPEPPSATQQKEQYWVTSRSGKTHNYRCRYYKNSQGYFSDKGTGNNCKLCGGAR